MDMINIFTVFILALFVGIEIITKVPPTLHTPLMSGSNAISGIAIVGAIIATKVGGEMGTWLGLVAVIFATINCVGGFMVTDRMLKMFKRKYHDRYIRTWHTSSLQSCLFWVSKNSAHPKRLEMGTPSLLWECLSPLWPPSSPMVIWIIKQSQSV